MYTTTFLLFNRNELKKKGTSIYNKDFLIERRMQMGNVNIKREETFIIIPKWMREELDLKGNELLIYALIFDRSNAGKCWFTTQHKYFSEWCGCSRQSVISTINNLVNKELITKRKDYDENGYLNGCAYKAVIQKGE